MLNKHVRTDDVSDNHQTISPMFGSRVMGSGIPRYEMASGEMEADAAYQLLGAAWAEGAPSVTAMRAATQGTRRRMEESSSTGKRGKRARGTSPDPRERRYFS